MLPELRSPHEGGNSSALKVRVLKPVNGAERHERDSVSDALDEESQGTLVRPLHPLVSVVDLHCGHELTDQRRVEDVWVGGHVAHSQLHEHVLEVLSDAHLSNHIRVNYPCRLNGDLQPLIEDQAVVVVPLVSNLTVYACLAFDRSTRVIEACKEWDGIFLALSFPRVLVVNWWRRSCTGAAGVESLVRSPFIHLQPKFTKENTKSANRDGSVVVIVRQFYVDIDRHISAKIDRCKCIIINRYSRRENLQNPINAILFA